MDTKPSKEKRASYNSKADVIMRMARNESNGLIGDEAIRIYEEPTEAEVRMQIEKIFLNMLQRG